MIEHFHSLNIKTILWVTSMINTDSTYYDFAREHGYLLSGGLPVKWWKGHGALLDYTNPAAVEWWHSLMDTQLDQGISGWKVDGTDPYIYELGYAIGHDGKHVEYREYADAYYRDFLDYTRERRGFDDALIWARPVDSDWSFAPHDVMFSGWIGDTDPSWTGMKAALSDMIHSAWRNYLNFGFDIGGYRSGDHTVDLFVRWFQLGTFVPLMENGGEDQHRPWEFSQGGNATNVTDVYRKFVNIHLELMPYFLSSGTTAYAQNVSVYIPMAVYEDPLPFTPSSWAFKMWQDIFVSPIVEDAFSTDIHFPVGEDKWVFWFDSSKVFAGGEKVTDFACDYGHYPAFQRYGSGIPLYVENEQNGNGFASSKGALTVMFAGLHNGNEVVNVHNTPTKFNGLGQRIRYTHRAAEHELDVTVSAHERPVDLLFKGVLVNGETLTIDGAGDLKRHVSHEALFAMPGAIGYAYDATLAKLTVRLGAPTTGLVLTVRGIASQH